MSLILTVPERLALMCTDAHPSIVASYSEYVEQLDSLQAPAWVIEVGEGSYSGGAEGDADFTENYVLSLIGKPLGQGALAEYELQMRAIVDSTIRYFLRHSQLQFSNERALEGLAPLQPLNDIKHFTLRRSPATLSSKGVNENFWGTQLTLEIVGATQYTPVLIPRTA